MFDNRTDVEDPAALAEAPRSSDPERVYGGLEFAERDLRPYRPSRLADDAITYEVIDELEDRYGVAVELKSDDPTRSGSWRVVVDGETAITTTHTRKAEGFTRYGITESELREAVAAARAD